MNVDRASLLLFGALVSLNPGCSNPGDHSRLARSAFAIGDYDLAIAEASEALREDSNSTMLLALRGRAYLEKGLYGSSLTDVRHVFDMTLDTAVMVYLGDCYRGMDSLQKALECYEAAIAFDSTLASAFYGRARVYSASNRCDQAVSDYACYIRMKGPDYRALNSLGLCRRNLGDLISARRCFNDCIKLDSSNWVAHYNLSTLEFISGDTAEAIRRNYLALALSQDEDALLLRERGKMFYHPANLDTACALWTSAAQLGDAEAKQLLKQYCDHSVSDSTTSRSDP